MDVYIERPRGLIRLTGPQRVWFLQNTVTADVESTEPGRWVESCFLEPKGHVLAHFRVGIAQEEVWLDVDPPATAELVDWFVRYRFRTKVEVEDMSTNCYTVLGPHARTIAASGEFSRDEYQVTFGGDLGPLAVTDIHAGRLPEALTDLERGTPELYERLRIEAGVGAFGVDYGPKTLPQEAGLTNTVSIEKGCYVGQEVVARIHFRGHINKVLRRLELEGVQEPVGKSLHLDGNTIGTITSAADGKAIAMVRVEPDEGTELEVEGGGTARLGPLPPGTKTKK